MYVMIIDAFITLLSLGFQHFCKLTSLSHPDRSQQLFGPCRFSSAYQHALVPVINIGECWFSASSSLFSHHIIHCS